MTTPGKLKLFDVTGTGDRFVLRIEDDKGNTVDLLATRDQLDLMADALDDALLSDEADGDEGD